MNPTDDAIISFLSPHPLFSRFSREGIVQLLQFAEVRQQVPAGATIFHEGEQAESFLIVMNGAVEVVKAGEDGNEHRLTRLDTGKTVGEMALLDPAPFCYGANIGNLRSDHIRSEKV